MYPATCLEHSSKRSAGYATTRWQGRVTYKHRKAYCEAHCLSLPDIDGKVVRHSCDNPRCVSPEHLLLGTHADNMKDMVDRGRHPGGRYRPHYDAIRKEYRRGVRGFGVIALAHKYDISPTHVRKIIQHKENS